MSRLPAAGGAHLVVLRNVWVHKGGTPWTMALFSVYEPVLYLLALGVGVGTLVGEVPGVDVPYAAFVAPALLAVAMMNSALEETTNTVYGKLTFDRFYHSLLVTPMTVRGMVAGELLWAAARALVTGVGFLAVIAALGLVGSPWAVLAVPAGLLTAFAFGAFGLAAAAYARGWHSFQYVQLVMLPMFLFATTFYPVTVYAGWVRVLVEALPLYHAIELSRGLALGEAGPGLLLNAAYLVVFGGVMLAVAQSRWATLMAR